MMQRGGWRQWLLALTALHGIIACAGFFAPYDPTEQDRERPYLPPMKMHLGDSQGHLHFHPFFSAVHLRDGAFDRFNKSTHRFLPLLVFVTPPRHHIAR